jgi:hypothetical protein
MSALRVCVAWQERHERQERAGASRREEADGGRGMRRREKVRKRQLKSKLMRKSFHHR